MKSNSILLLMELMVAFLLITGCGGGGGGGKDGLYIEKLDGPKTVNENTDVQYTVTAKGDTNITYAWACDPSSAGTWTNGNKAIATFHASFVPTNAPATIRITLNSAKDKPVIGEIKITVKDTGAVPIVSDISGPVTLNENSFAHYGVTVTEDTGITYDWTCEPSSAGTWTIKDTATATFYAGSVSADTPVTVKVSVDSTGLSAPVVKELGITVKKNLLPIAKAKADPNPQTVGWPVQFSDDGSSDPDGGSITKFEWDFTNDGGTDAEGSTVDYIYNTPGTYHVQMRVTDDEGSTEMLDEPLEIVIESPPVAKAKADPNLQTEGTPVQFSDYGSYDPDSGSIMKFEWDFTNDGGADAEGSSVEHVYNTPGTYQVQLRVTDDEGQTDMLDEPLEVVIQHDDGTLNWAKRAGGASGDDYGHGITTLSDNSTVVTGSFNKAAKFGPGEPNETILTSVGGKDIFIARYNPDGTLAWAKSAGGTTNYDWGNGITMLSDNSTVVTGYFWESAIFGPGEPNQTVLTSAGDGDIFIARYNPDGTLAWVKSVGGTHYDEGYGVTTLSDNSTVVTRNFSNTATFGKGEPNETILTSAGDEDIFIARYNPDGTLAWAKKAGGAGTDESCGITTLSDNSTVVTGDFSTSATFGKWESSQTVLTSAGFDDMFIARYNPDGTLAWAKRAGGWHWERSFGITTLSDNSTIVTGYFWELATFGPGELNQTVLTSAGYSDIFIARYNPDGTLNWVKRAGGGGPLDQGQGITTLSDNSTVVTGFFYGSATFGIGDTNHTVLTSAGGMDIFIARYNPDGTLAWAKRTGGGVEDYSYGITTLSDNSTVVTGFFSSTAKFGPGEPNQTVLTSAGDMDIFIARFKP